LRLLNTRLRQTLFGTNGYDLTFTNRDATPINNGGRITQEQLSKVFDIYSPPVSAKRRREKTAPASFSWKKRIMYPSPFAVTIVDVPEHPTLSLDIVNHGIAIRTPSSHLRNFNVRLPVGYDVSMPISLCAKLRL
jgi:hypothetical protein